MVALCARQQLLAPINHGREWWLWCAQVHMAPVLSSLFLCGCGNTAKRADPCSTHFMPLSWVACTSAVWAAATTTCCSALGTHELNNTFMTRGVGVGLTSSQGMQHTSCMRTGCLVCSCYCFGRGRVQQCVLTTSNTPGAAAPLSRGLCVLLGCVCVAQQCVGQHSRRCARHTSVSCRWLAGCVCMRPLL